MKHTKKLSRCVAVASIRKHAFACAHMLCVQDLRDRFVLITPFVVDQQEDGSLSLCQRRWCDIGIASTSVMKRQLRLTHQHTSLMFMQSPSSI